jgi:hypothetical protein
MSSTSHVGRTLPPIVDILLIYLINLFLFVKLKFLWPIKMEANKF